MILFIFLISFIYCQNQLPVYICGLENINDYNIFADGGWDGNWHVGYNHCWIKKLPPPPKGNYRKAYIGAKLGRAKTRRKLNRPIWEKEPIPGEIFMAISSTPAWPAERRHFLVTTEDIPLEPDPDNALIGVGESRWFWCEVPLDQINFNGNNYLCLWSPTAIFSGQPADWKTEPVKREKKEIIIKSKTCKIEGRVMDVSHNGIKDIKVVLQGINFSTHCFTDDFGRYAFNVPADATYSTFVDLPGYSVSPPQYEYKDINSNYFGDNFVLRAMGAILCGGWTYGRETQTTAWLNMNIKGIPPITPEGALATPISIFDPAMAIKLIPEGTEQDIKIYLTKSSKDGLIFIQANIAANQIERVWIEYSTDKISWKKKGRYLYTPPFIFTLKPVDFPPGRFFIKICAADIWENIGCSDIMEVMIE